MSSNVVNFPIIPRATAFAQEDERDPHTTALEMFKKFRQFSIQNCGRNWTANVIRASQEIEDMNDWRARARKLFESGDQK